jgi:capsular exopolysaccharide synthesis family protein
MATLAPLGSEAPPPAPSERDLDIRYYADLLWRGRTLVAAGALVGLLLGLLVAFSQTPEYRAGVMLQIEPPNPAFMTVSDALMGANGFWQNADFYNTQFKVVRSKGLGEKVVERLKLSDHPPYQANPDAGALFMAHVGVEPVPESRLVVVTVTHPSPQDAALWANTLAETYVETTLESRVESAKKAYTWLQERLAATQQSMRDAQEKLFKGLQTQDLFVPEGSVSAVSASIAKLNEDFVTARTRRITIEAALQQIEDMRRRGEALDTVPQVAVDSVVVGLNAQIAGLNVDLSRLLEKYKPAHPEVQKLEAQVAEIKKSRATRAEQIVGGLRAEFVQLQKRENELKAAIDGQKALAADQSRKVSELEALKKESESSKGLYEVLLQKLNESDIAASIRSNNVTVVERASPPRSPVRPDKRKIGLAGLILGLALGVGLVLGRDYLDNTVRDPEEVERYLHLNLLAAVPRYDAENAHLVTEAYQNLRTALLFARRDEQEGEVILITGSAPQEGKTTTLVNIARLLAGAGEKTVVLDCDLRRAQLHHRLGLPREPGLTDYFVKHTPLEDLVRTTDQANLFVLTAGPLPPNPPALLARRAMGDLLRELRERFEWVLIDSPPLASVTDALLLARQADVTVMVVQHNKVDKKVVKRSVNALRKATPNVLGVVLNQVDIQQKGYYYYYYQDDAGADSPTGGKRGDGQREPAPADATEAAR